MTHFFCADIEIDYINQAPKLNASLRLDNFLQMQYEIIAKQLTLLRDEVGPGERIVFLEMPQSVNAVYDKANNKWAQSWWKVAGYTTLRDKVENDRERSYSCVSGYKPTGESKDYPTSPDKTLTMKDIIRDAIAAFGDNGKGSSGRVEYVPLDAQTGGLRIEDRSVRTIELIPRQGSLNVNDIKLRVKSGVLTAIARTLFGFGASLNVQRQRETYDPVATAPGTDFVATELVREPPRSVPRAVATGSVTVRSRVSAWRSRAMWRRCSAAISPTSRVPNINQSASPILSMTTGGIRTGQAGTAPVRERLRFPFPEAPTTGIMSFGLMVWSTCRRITPIE